LCCHLRGLCPLNFYGLVFLFPWSTQAWWLCYLSWILPSFQAGGRDFELHWVWYQTKVQVPLIILVFPSLQFECSFMCFTFVKLLLCHENCNHIHFTNFFVVANWIFFYFNELPLDFNLKKSCMSKTSQQMT
jgi:hypothetical protein